MGANNANKDKNSMSLCLLITFLVVFFIILDLVLLAPIFHDDDDDDIGIWGPEDFGRRPFGDDAIHITGPTWGPWRDWSECSAICGIYDEEHGTHRRYRYCQESSTLEWLPMEDCPGNESYQTELCIKAC